MRVKALVSFAGAVTMAKGEIGEITNKALLADLQRAGYIEAKKEEAANDEKGGAKKNGIQ